MSRKKVQRWAPWSLCSGHLYMEFFEELALEMAPTTSRLWKKHIDDTFCILRKDSAEELLHHLNGSGRPLSSLWSRKKTGHSLFSTRYSREERMAAWMSLPIGSRRTQTGISTSDPREERCVPDIIRVKVKKCE